MGLYTCNFSSCFTTNPVSRNSICSGLLSVFNPPFSKICWYSPSSLPARCSLRGIRALIVLKCSGSSWVSQLSIIRVLITDSTHFDISSSPCSLFPTPRSPLPKILHTFWVKKGCPPVQYNTSFNTSWGFSTLPAKPSTNDAASANWKPLSWIAIPKLNGVRLLSLIKSPGVATPNRAKVNRL